MADCGTHAQSLNKARATESFRTEYAGKTVEWRGTILSPSNELIGTGYSVHIRMNPTESLIADVVLSVPQRLKEQVLALNRGDTVSFRGTLAEQGGTFTSHRIEVAHLAVLPSGDLPPKEKDAAIPPAATPPTGEAESTQEPVLRGKTLRHWLNALRRENDDGINDAIEAFDDLQPNSTGAMPTLIEFLSQALREDNHLMTLAAAGLIEKVVHIEAEHCKIPISTLVEAINPLSQAATKPGDDIVVRMAAVTSELALTYIVQVLIRCTEDKSSDPVLRRVAAEAIQRVDFKEIDRVSKGTDRPQGLKGTDRVEAARRRATSQTVAINAEVVFDGRTFVIQNTDQLDWDNVRLEVQARQLGESRTFTATVSEIRARSTLRIGEANFAADGLLLGASGYRVERVTISSDTPFGPGAWTRVWGERR